MSSELLATSIPNGPGLPIPWWGFWWALALVVFLGAIWWWNYLAVRHDRDLHDEAREAVRRPQADQERPPAPDGEDA